MGITGFAYLPLGFLFSLLALLRVRKWKIQPQRSLDYGMLMQSMPLVFINCVIQVVFVPVVFRMFSPDSSFEWQSRTPIWKIVSQTAVSMLVNEYCFFHVHRWMHVNKNMYAAVHKIHHKWTAPIAIMAIYCHPLEHVIANLTPVVLGPILCRMHVTNFAVYVVAGVVHTMLVHSGYWMCDDDGMHDEHHAKFNVNFGIMGIMDQWYGTYQLPTMSSEE